MPEDTTKSTSAQLVERNGCSRFNNQCRGGCCINGRCAASLQCVPFKAARGGGGRGGGGGFRGGGGGGSASGFGSGSGSLSAWEIAVIVTVCCIISILLCCCRCVCMEDDEPAPFHNRRRDDHAYFLRPHLYISEPALPNAGHPLTVLSTI